MPPVEDSVLWHDAIPRKKSLCQANALLLVVKRFGVSVVLPMVFRSTLTLSTFILFCFFLCLISGST